jgi:hypothetical protein
MTAFAELDAQNPGYGGTVPQPSTWTARRWLPRPRRAHTPFPDGALTTFRFGSETGPTKGCSGRAGVRPIEASRVGVCYVRYTSTPAVAAALCRNPRHQHPRHFRVRSTYAVRPNDKIRRIEDVRRDEIQQGTIDLRTLRLHQVKRSKMNFDDPSLPSCITPIVGS